MVAGKVVGRKRDSNGKPIRRENKNPMLDTRVYEVEFVDGGRTEFGANAVAENMYAQCDVGGNQLQLMDCIMDHRKDDKVITAENQYFIIRGRKQQKHMTRGWHLCIKWKDKSTSWEQLSDLKESYPVEVAEYAAACDLQEELAFSWWIPQVLRKRARIIAAVNKRYHKHTHKFGIRVLKTVWEALDLDKANGNDLWWEAIKKEMKAVRIAFKILGNDKKPPPASQFMKCHMIFDIKMEDFRRKARLVAGGHMMETPKTLTYASIMSRETVQIALTVAALNNLVFKYARKGCKNQIVTAGRLVTVLDMRPSTTNTLTTKRATKITAHCKLTLLWITYANPN